MSEAKGKIGEISWVDLTVNDAEGTRQFYEAVTGWSSKPVPMGEYEDHCMETRGGETVAGICHTQGANASLPPQWLIYINVEDLDVSIERCESMGGKVLQGPREISGGRFAVIQDPAGACAALYEPPEDTE
jgi:predicted enzyme related to lactoylglutathione lyase